MRLAPATTDAPDESDEEAITPRSLCLSFSLSRSFLRLPPSLSAGKRSKME